nr:hypothetical protein [Tanacetum cinerariifolium]
MTKPYLSHHFLANCFIAGNIKREWRYEHANPVSLKAQDGGNHMTMSRDYAWLMISRHSISSLPSVKDQANIQKSIIQITEKIVRLKERVQVLEDREGVAAKQSGDDAPIKGRSINEGEAAAERISNDSEDIARVLTFIDAATVLAGGIDVPTGSGFIPTIGPLATVISTGSEVGPTASPIATRRKGKEV